MPYETQKALSAETQEVFPKRRGDLAQAKRRMVYFNARMAGVLEGRRTPDGALEA